jgi:hypothetical protein
MRKSTTKIPIASAARTASGSQLLTGFPADWDELTLYLDVTAVTGTTPTLDVIYEVSDPQGNWYTHTSLTQATATTTERKVATAPIGVNGRISWTIAGTDTPTFTFSVGLEAKRTGAN